MARPKCIHLIGLPGVGKSTLREQFIAELNEPIIASSDDELNKIADIHQITYSEAFLKYITSASTAYTKSLTLASSTRRDIIVDRTNLTPAARRRLFNTLFSHEHWAVVVRCPETTRQQRLAELKKYGKSIPTQTDEQMRRSFVFPMMTEGYTKLITIDN